MMTISSRSLLRFSSIVTPLFLLFLTGTAGPASAQTIRINCGGWSENYTDHAGNVWLTDRYYEGGGNSYTGEPISQDWALYATGRRGVYADFRYVIPVSNGSYRLTLKFAETQGLSPGDRVFNVLVNGTKVLSNFDIRAEVANRIPLDKSFTVSATNGSITIDFDGVVNYGIVAGIELIPATGSISVSPATATAVPNQKIQFTATTNGAPAPVTWSLSGDSGVSLGTISGAGLYTAPSSISQSSVVTVKATSTSNPNNTDTATVTLKSAVAVSVSPATAEVLSGGTVQLTATVNGSPDSRVQWSATSGSVNSTGLFQAPSVTSSTTVTVTARSVADPSATDTSQITVRPASAPGPASFIESGGQVVMEAESGAIVNRSSKTWVSRTNHAGFSGASFLSAEPNAGTIFDGDYSGTAPEIRFQVRFATTGTYYIWVRGYSTGFADDSLHVGLDGTAVTTGEKISEFPIGSWAWTSSAMDNVRRATLVVSSAGVHTVNVWMREDGFSFDKLLLTTSSGLTPSGAGPAQSAIDSATPALSVSPASVSFAATVGGSNPAAKSITISNIGGGTLNWTISEGLSWLTLSATSGTAPRTVTLSPVIAGLAAGTHTGSITINAAGAAGSPVTVPITLSLSSASSPAALRVSPSDLTFSASSGAGNPAAQSISITNAGSGSLSWTATKTKPWLSLSATSGSAPASVSVQANIAGLSAGTHTDVITIAAAGAADSPQQVDVTLTVSGTPPPPTSGRQFYVTPSGSASGDGSTSRPWSLAAALAHPSTVQPGDTIWLRGGKYGDGRTVFASKLSGTAANPIVVRQYPGERATIDGSLQIYGPYTWYWGFEVMSSYPDRGDQRGGAGDAVDTYPGSRGVKLINLVLHDAAQGVGFWEQSIDSEAYGNLIYYNGWAGPTRGHGHGIYTQNRDGVKKITDNIIFNQFGLGIQAYGSGSAYVQGYDMDGNILFNNGSLYSTSNKVDNILVTGGTGTRNITIENTYTYHTPSTNDGYSRLGWQFGSIEYDIVARHNYWMGGESAIEMWNWQSATYTNNVAYSANNFTTVLQAGSQRSGYTFDNNTYYGSGLFRFNGSNQSFESWKSATGLDRNSRYIAGRPTGVWTFVRPNRYEPGRANVVIYNWNLQSSVPVNVSGVLTPGRPYVVRDAQNFFGPPVASGTYSGGTIAIPMTGLTIAAPVGNVPARPAHTGPEFGAFVVLQQ